MRQTTIEIICCPTCHSTLSLSTKFENGNIDSGNLLCSTCQRNYPIQNGIVHFIQPDELEGSNQHFESYHNHLAPFYTLFSKFAFLPFGGERKARQEILDRLEIDGGGYWKFRDESHITQFLGEMVTPKDNYECYFPILDFLYFCAGAGFHYIPSFGTT